MLSRIFLGVLPLWCCGSVIVAAPLRHVHQDGDSISRFQLQGSCQIIATDDDSRWCNPANLSVSQSFMAIGDGGIRAEEDGVKVFNKATSGKIQKSDVENLFSKKSFSAISGYVRLESKFRNFSISYVPLYAVGAYHVANPALPEISLSAFKQSEVRLQTGVQLLDFSLLGSNWTINGGDALYYFNRQSIAISDQLINILVNPNGTFGNVQSSQGVDEDIGVTLKNDQCFIPDLGMIIQRVHHAYDQHGDEASQNGQSISLARYTSRQSSLSVGKVLTLPVGILGLEFNERFDQVLGDPVEYSSSLGLRFGLGGFNTFLSVSPVMDSFGFTFQSPIYLVGIQYTNEKQSNDLQLPRQRMTYVYARLHF